MRKKIEWLCCKPTVRHKEQQIMSTEEHEPEKCGLKERKLWSNILLYIRNKTKPPNPPQNNLISKRKPLSPSAEIWSKDDKASGDKTRRLRKEAEKRAITQMKTKLEGGKGSKVTIENAKGSKR